MNKLNRKAIVVVSVILSHTVCVDETLKRLYDVSLFTKGSQLQS